MKLDFDFDPNDYESFKEVSQKPALVKSKSNERSITRGMDFDENDYTDTTEEHPYFGQYAQYTPSQYESLSSEKKQELQGYSPLQGFFKGILSGSTLGATEYAEPLENKPEDVWFGAGEAVGAIAPIGLAAKAVSLPFKLLGNLTRFTNPVQKGIGIAKSAATGATYGTGRETVKAAAGEEFNLGNVVQDAALFGGTHALFEAIPAASRWIKSLNTKQRAEIATKGMMPTDLDPRKYLELQNEIMPEMQKYAEAEYQTALNEAKEAANKEFEQKMQNVRAKHENDLMEQSQKKQLAKEDFETAQKEYQNEMKQVGAEHEAKVAKIQEENAAAEEAFNQQKKEYDNLKRRQSLVDDAIRPQMAQRGLEGRVTKYGDDVGFRPAPTILENPSLKNEVGSIFSDNEVNSYRGAGEANVKAIRSNDNFDYQIVNEAYDNARNLNSKIETAHPNLVMDLIKTRNDLQAIPKLSPPQEQKLAFAEKILEQIAEFGPQGTVIKFKPINNNILSEQAKAIRYTMDFNFEHGNTRGIFSPMVNQIEDSIDVAARMMMNEEASVANKEARTLYREWAETYDNKTIRPFRDTSNQDYNSLFKSTLDPDSNVIVENILNKSNAGQQVARGNKRELVDKYLKKYFDNPRSAVTSEFNDTMKELRGVITPEQEAEIAERFREARRRPSMVGRKAEEVKAPKPPEKKELPLGKFNTFEKKIREVPEITEVSIPLKGELQPTKAMQAAAKKMNRTKDQIMNLSNSAEGLAELKETLPKELYTKMAKDKARQIFYSGKLRHKMTGEELYNSIRNENNFEIISELFGEEAASELLNSAEEIASSEVTANSLKKAGSKAKTLAKLKMFGIL